MLKTLEEPPSNVKFIFATTEIRKVPVTILSRCQRFDLRRVDVPTLKNHFASICNKENVTAEEEALQLIAQSADGSVRDGLSLLDQAMALGEAGSIKADEVATMLGSTDRIKILDLVEAGLGGSPKLALDIMDDLYKMGADPRAVIQDMMDMVHGLSVMAIDRDTVVEALPHAAMDKAKEMASRLTVPQLQKAWQVLMKGLGEISNAPNGQKAAEMVVLRLVYAADLPDPADLLKKIKARQTTSIETRVESYSDNGGDERPQLKAINGGGIAMQPIPETVSDYSAQPKSLQEVISLFENKGEMMIAAHLYHDIACVSLKPGHFEFTPYDNAPTDLAGHRR